MKHSQGIRDVCVFFFLNSGTVLGNHNPLLSKATALLP